MTDVNRTTLFDTGSSPLIYIGESANGVATSAAFWRITRIDTTTSVIKIAYAEKNDYFDKIWDNRASYTYG
jgi:hypothetical protein